MKPKFLVHNYLENLINKRFGIFVDIDHQQFSPAVENIRGKKIRARTTVWGYNSIEDAKKGENFVVMQSAECSENDPFVKRTGLTIALRRLYRELADKQKTT